MAATKNLVIVESPAKAKTIEKFLGKDYKVMSSCGHIRDLSKKDFSIGGTHSFEPEYEVSPDKVEIVDGLRKAAKNAGMVWLASDEDREGEAIAWHLYVVLGLKPENTRRIVFHEITKPAILAAIENPRDIDINLVDAQQARRLLDRIVGFELSPVLWKKIKPALSAGRVQSVAVRLIVERENEIRNFKSESYFRVTARFTAPDGQTVKAELPQRLATFEQARQLLADCAEATFGVADINVKPLKKAPAPPFTTSTLQQEAARKLGFTVSQTMMIAQHLYEAGHITYMRTDSLNLSNLALGSIAEEIKNKMGEKYLKVRKYHTKSKGAQEAHEAIRPTYIDKHDIEGTQQERRLYKLIWTRTVASQMADAEIEKTTVDIKPSTRSENFVAQGEVVKFSGFLKVYKEGSDDAITELPEGMLPAMKKGDSLGLADLTAAERFTQHPPRYTEASFIKKMEELGIGRPSTYAPTISTIQQREYVTKSDIEGKEREVTNLRLVDGKVKVEKEISLTGADKGKLIPTDIGVIVNDFLSEYFPNILDYNFTASMEENLDRVAEGEAEWKSQIGEFYDVFHPEVERANDIRLDHKVGERVLGADPATGKPVSVKIGRFGPVVQIGDSSDEEKPRFASLRKEQSVFDITLDEALKLFDLPRSLGQFEDAEVSVGVGRFGPYVKHASKYVSIPKTISPLEITLDEAVELIKAKREADSKKVVKTFPEDAEMQILNGRFGVYISYKKANYKLPKGIENPAELSYDDCLKIVQEQDSKPKRTVARRSTARRTAKK